MKAFFKHFSFILLYIILCQVMPAVIILSTHQIKYSSYTFAVGGILCAIIGWLMYRKELKIYTSLLFSKSYYFPLLIATWIIFILIAGILATILGLQTTQNQESINLITSYLPVPILIIVVAIVYPFIEELIFRHILITKLEHTIPISLATIISCALFAGIHAGNDWTTLAVYLPMSIGLTVAYFLTKGRVMGSFVYHIIQNSLAVTVMLLH